MVHLNDYLLPIFDPEFNRNDRVVVYDNESIVLDAVCTKGYLCHQINSVINKEKEYFIVACMYISASVKQPLFLKELQLLKNDFSKLKRNPAFIVGVTNIDHFNQNNSSTNYSNLTEYNGITQLLATATRSTVDSAFLINHIISNLFLENPYFGIVDAGLTDLCVTIANLPVPFEIYIYTETTYNVFLFINNEIASQLCLELYSEKLKVPHIYYDLVSQFRQFLQPLQNGIEQCSFVKQSSNKTFKPFCFLHKVKIAIIEKNGIESLQRETIHFD